MDPIVDDPLFKLKILGKVGSDKVISLTVRPDCSSPGAKKSYADFLEWLTIRVNEKEIIRYVFARSLLYIILIYVICDSTTVRNNVWDAIAWTKTTGSDFPTKKGETEKSRRLDEFRQREPRRESQLVDERSKTVPPQKRSASQFSLRFTPPIPSSITVSGNQKSKQRSRLDFFSFPFR